VRFVCTDSSGCRLSISRDKNHTPSHPGTGEGELMLSLQREIHALLSSKYREAREFLLCLFILKRLQPKIILKPKWPILE
jgi:hypothetical protein